MKIFYFAWIQLPEPDDPGGARRHVTEVINNFVDQGHDVTVFVTGQIPETNPIDAQKIVTFNPSGGYLGFLRGIFSSLLAMVTEIINQGKPDVIYSREMPYTCHTALLALLYNIPHFMEANGFLPEAQKLETNYDPKLYPVLIFMEALNYWLSQGIFTVTNVAENKITWFYALDSGNVHSVRNGANTDLIEPLDRDECLRKLGLDVDQFYVGFMGTLARWSGVEILADAASILHEEYDEIEFIIISGTPSKGGFKESVHKRGLGNSFHFFGPVAWRKIPRYLSALDVGVTPLTPHNTGGDPLKNYEYMASGLPIIVSDVNNMGEMVEREQCGLVFQPGSPQSLKDRIITLYENHELRQKFGKNARTAVQERYDWEHTTRKISTILENSF